MIITLLYDLIQVFHIAVVFVEGLARGFDAGRRELFNNDGLQVLIENLKSHNIKILSKSLFLLNHLYSTGNEGTYNNNILCCGTLLLIVVFRDPRSKVRGSISRAGVSVRTL